MMHKAITPDYYGFRDEEDGVLETLEAEAEKIMRAQVRLQKNITSYLEFLPSNLTAHTLKLCFHVASTF
jgi:hypothetical protein